FFSEGVVPSVRTWRVRVQGHLALLGHLRVRLQRVAYLPLWIGHALQCVPPASVREGARCAGYAWRGEVPVRHARGGVRRRATRLRRSTAPPAASCRPVARGRPSPHTCRAAARSRAAPVPERRACRGTSTETRQTDSLRARARSRSERRGTRT